MIWRGKRIAGLKRPLLLFLIILIPIISSGCKQKATAAEVIQGYLNALVAKDVTKAVKLSCAGWEEQALAEGAAFEGVTVKLDGLLCKDETASGQDQGIVTCAGKFVYSYASGENMEIPLAGRIFLVTREDNNWKMCGYK